MSLQDVSYGAFAALGLAERHVVVIPNAVGNLRILIQAYAALYEHPTNSQSANKT